MPEEETPENQDNKIEVLSDPAQVDLFKVGRREGGNWVLSVNNSLLEAQGFTPDQVSGAIALESQRLALQLKYGRISDGLRSWQQISEGELGLRPFQILFERLAAVRFLTDKEDGRLAVDYLGESVRRLPQDGFLDQLYLRISQKALGLLSPSPADSWVEKMFDKLCSPEKVEDRSVSPLEVLLSPGVSFNNKAAWLEQRFLPRFRFLKTKEEEGKKQESPQESTGEEEKKAFISTEQATNMPTLVLDEYQQLEGGVKKGEYTFVVSPFYPGYWEEDSYDAIEEETGRLSKSEKLRERNPLAHWEKISPSGEMNCRLRVSSGNSLFSLPLPKGFFLTEKSDQDLRAKQVKVYQDADGHLFLEPSAAGELEIEIGLTTPGSPGSSSPELILNDNRVSEELPEEISVVLAKIKEGSGSSLEKAIQWKSFIQLFFKYPNPSEFASMYANVNASPGKRITALTQMRLLDCHLAREFYLAGLKRLALPDLEWRAARGYFLGKKQEGNIGFLQAENKHAWAKVRMAANRDWVIVDPVPSGDPALYQEGVSEGRESDLDFLTEEELIQFASEKPAALPFTPEETNPQDEYVRKFAEETGMDPAEAKKILATLEEVEKMTDSQGRRILRRLEEEFSRLVQEYVIEVSENFDPVAMSEGIGLSDPVAAWIDLLGQIPDPTGFEIETTREEKEKVYGGFDLTLAGDKSTSMLDPCGGKIKYLEQRKMVYLILRAVHYFAEEAKKAKAELVTPLDVRSQAITFQGGDKENDYKDIIEVVKPLGSEFTPKQMAYLWEKLGQNIGNGTPDHSALKSVLDGITPEEEELLKEKRLLKIVILIRDGGSDDSDKTKAMIRRLREMNVIVADFLIDDRNPVSRLPEMVAEQVIEAVRLMMPKRVK